MLELTTVGAELAGAWVCRLGFSSKVVSPWLMVPIANFCRDKSSTYIKNLIQGFVALAW
ncbi:MULTISPECIES: hypothetical protein [unclassified Pseudoalteromonas]|uniref:hypothetical protein n=1 Tax=unclassified Pseudoalteromonas TaxID=194690 RepID=UPI0025B506BC|nr:MULTISPECIES: hypothetical protein [unclassified Pseudoalteromonas]MDN3379917.1 hypothetical protein [Pseudoalteromonas sp. APC 3893]MDN3388256.1 hypothetical protein [Pseudoalteromonas sp. APC 4017]